MSIGALLLASRDRLRDVIERTPHLNIPENDIDVMPDQRPKSNVGETFLALYATQWVNHNPHVERALEEQMGIAVAITQRIGVSPPDRHGSIYAGILGSMTNLAYSVAIAIHQWEGLFAATNQYLADLEDVTTSDSDLEGLYEYLRWASTDPNPQQVGSDHFVASVGGDGYATQHSGYVMQVRFQGAKRMTKQSRFAALL